MIVVNRRPDNPGRANFEYMLRGRNMKVEADKKISPDVSLSPRRAGDSK
jgi:hypothetical protein